MKAEEAAHFQALAAAEAKKVAQEAAHTELEASRKKEENEAQFQALAAAETKQTSQQAAQSALDSARKRESEGVKLQGLAGRLAAASSKGDSPTSKVAMQLRFEQAVDDDELPGSADGAQSTEQPVVIEDAYAGSGGFEVQRVQKGGDAEADAEVAGVLGTAAVKLTDNALTLGSKIVEIAEILPASDQLVDAAAASVESVVEAAYEGAAVAAQGFEAARTAVADWPVATELLAAAREWMGWWGSTPDPATAPVPVGGTIPRSPALAPTAAPAAVTYVTPA